MHLLFTWVSGNCYYNIGIQSEVNTSMKQFFTIILLTVIGMAHFQFAVYFSRFPNLFFTGGFQGFVIEINKNIKDTNGKSYARYNTEFLLPKFSLTICLRWTTWRNFELKKQNNFQVPVIVRNWRFKLALRLQHSSEPR